MYYGYSTHGVKNRREIQREISDVSTFFGVQRDGDGSADNAEIEQGLKRLAF